MSNEPKTTYYLRSTVLGGVAVIEIVPGGYGTKENLYIGSQKIAEHFPDSGFLGWRHVNPVTGSWLTSVNASGGGYTYRNELDPLGSEVGIADPYVSYTTYSDIMGPVSLYEERGNPFDPGGGCATVDGMPMSCSELNMRMQGGSVATEYPLIMSNARNGSRQPERREIRSYGLGLFGIWLADDARGADRRWTLAVINAPQKTGVEYLPRRDGDSYGDKGEGWIKSIIDSLLKNEKCRRAFEIVGLQTINQTVANGLVIGPATLLNNPANNRMMGIQEGVRRNYSSEFSKGAEAGTIRNIPGQPSPFANSADQRPRMFIATAAFNGGQSDLRWYMVHEFMHAGGQGKTSGWFGGWSHELAGYEWHDFLQDACK